MNKRNMVIRTSAAYTIMLSLLLILNYSAISGQPVEAPPPVTIAGTQLVNIPSSITNKEYTLYINLPASYSGTEKSYPVLYLLDAQWDFTLMQSVYGQQYFDGFIPEIIIVGITWGGENPAYDQLRAHDFTPTDVSNNGTYGNASKFLSFIGQELIPFVEKNYRVKPDDRTLTGSSFGGLFSLFALYQNPGLFNRYIFTSPAIQWDNGILNSIQKNYSDKYKELNARVYTAIGEYENVPEFNTFIQGLQSLNLDKLSLKSEVIDNMGHSGGKAHGYSRGLQWVYMQPEVMVDPAVLQSYTGEYGNAQIRAKLEISDGKLIALVPGAGPIRLEAMSDTDFHVTGQFLRLHFEKDESGSIKGITVFQYGGQFFLEKLKNQL